MSVSFRASSARLAWILVPLLAIAAIAGCTLSSGGYNTTSPPKIRMFAAAIDISAVDLTLGNVLSLGGLGYEQFAPYRTTGTGQQPVVLTLSGTTTVLTQTTQDFENGDRFSYILYGRPSAPQTILLRDNVDLPGGGNYKLRLINAANESGPLDLWVTNAGTSIDFNGAPTINNVPLGGASDFVELGVGNVEVRLTRHGTQTVVYDSGQIALSERNAYAIVAYSRGNTGQVNAGVFTMDTLGSGQLINSTQSDVRLVNAVANVGPINLSVNGNVAIGSIAYAQASAYQPGPTGSQTISIAATSNPTTALLNGTQTFPAGGANTIVAFRNAGNVVALTLSDINFQPQTPGSARVRIVNAGSDIGGVSTLVNGSLTVGALGAGATSLYFELPPTSYTFTFVDPTTSAVLLDVPGVALAAGHTYTLFLIGPPGQLTSLLTQDN
jgi:hypothetical protein